MISTERFAGGWAVPRLHAAASCCASRVEPATERCARVFGLRDEGGIVAQSGTRWTASSEAVRRARRRLGRHFQGQRDGKWARHVTSGHPGWEKGRA